MPELSLKEKLRAGRVSIGAWLTLGHPALAEIMARAGFDWITVDLEHSVISIETAAELIRTIEQSGAVPLVRLTSNDADQAKRVMDAGAHGIIVPMVKSVAEAKHAVAMTRYGPEGIRGVGLARAQGYGVRFKEYLAWQRSEPIVVVQIEHVAALDVLDDILGVPGVDAFIVGPYDLSCSLGCPGDFEHPQFIAAMTRIRTASLNSKVAPGLHVVEPEIDSLRRVLRDGYRFVAYSVDIRMLDVSARAGAAIARECNQ